MAEQDRRQARIPQPLARATSPDRPAAKSDWGAWPWILGVVVLVAAANSCSTKPDASVTADPLPLTAEAPVEGPAATPEAGSLAVSRAARHAGLAIGADGAAGAMTYSVNCWAAVTRGFSLPALDRCGAFDALARRVRMLPSELPAEAAWFEADAARGRYVDAARAGGLDAEAGGSRMAALHQLASNEALVPKTPKAIAAVPTTADVASEPTDDLALEPVSEEVTTAGAFATTETTTDPERPTD